MRNITADKFVESKIYILRGKKVMLDADLAVMYDVKPIRLREQVHRNIERFPADFMFRINEKEALSMVSQNAIPSRKHLGGYLPYVFTREGISMLSSVLRSKRAIEAHIAIMRAFVRLHDMIASNAKLAAKLAELEKRYDAQFKCVFDAIKLLMAPPAIPPGTIKKVHGFRPENEPGPEI